MDYDRYYHANRNSIHPQQPMVMKIVENCDLIGCKTVGLDYGNQNVLKSLLNIS